MVFAQFRVFPFLVELAEQQLGIVVHLIPGITNPARTDTRFLKRFHYLVVGQGYGPPLYQVVQFLEVFQSRFQSGEPGLFGPVRITENAAEALPFLIGVHGNGAKPVFPLTGINPVGRGVGIVIALPGSDPAIHHVIKQQGGHKLHTTLVLGDVQVLPFTGSPPVIQCGQDSQGVKARGDKVGIESDLAGFAVRPAGNLVQA